MNLFPYDSVREVQKELIADVEKAISEGKNLLVNAPTGLGKTASTLPAALSYALEKGKVIFFLTNRHTQHQIAVETLKEIKEKHKAAFLSVDIVGKQWMCSQSHVNLLSSGDFNEYCKSMREGGKCEFYEKMKMQNKKGLSVRARRLVEDFFEAGPLDTEELKKKCQKEGLCAYYMAMELAKKAQIVVADYYYLFSPSVQENFFARIGRELEDCVLIVDEGHNLPDRVRNLMTSRLTSNMLRNAVKEAKKFGFSEAVADLSRLQDILLKINLDEAEEVLVEKEKFVNMVGAVKDYKKLIEELELAAAAARENQDRSYIGGIIGFLENWPGGDEGYVRYVTEKETRQGPYVALSYSCLDPSAITKNIFDQVQASVIMSGTLVPTGMFRDVLGVERAVEKNYGSPFPEKNKLSLIVPTVSTKYSLRNEKMFQKIAEKCSEIAKAVPGNTALFFPSYYLRDSIFKFFGQIDKKIILEKQEMGKEEKTKLIEDFKDNREKGAVLLGVAAANFSEGIDLPGDLLKCVVVVGLPLARPDLLTKQLIQYYDKKFSKGWDYGYIFPAINKVLQAAGRCIRSEKDKGAIVFMDVRFTWPNYSNCLQGWSPVYEEDYIGKIKEFFGN